jgi:hypothetical protein
MGFLQTGDGLANWNSIVTGSENAHTGNARIPQSDQLVRMNNDKY